MNRLHDPLLGDAQPPDDEQLELFALNLLDDDERAVVEQRLAIDPATRDRLRQMQGVLAMLAFDVEPMQASPGLKQRILDAARADLAAESDDPAPPVPPAPVSLAAE